MSALCQRLALLLSFAYAICLGTTVARVAVQGDRLDFQAHFHVGQHARGEATTAWLHNHTAVVPNLAKSSYEWPQHLVIGYASGYDFQVLRPLIYSFLAHADRQAWLVLLIEEDDVLDLPPQCGDRVVVQRHAMPLHLEDPEDIPYPVSLRFYVALSFLSRIDHNGTVFFLDTRDVFIQSNPFQDYADGIMHFPQESGSYKLKGPYTDNHQWLLLCFGNETSEAIGGHFVLNSGTLIGPSVMMRAYFELLLQELEHRWHCRRLHGSDQAIHNYLVYTGKLVRTGIRFQVEDHISGQFAFIAYSHPRVFDFRYISETREEMYNIGNGWPMVAIHLWPGDNRAAHKVVWPFVREFEAQLGIPTLRASSN